MTKSQAGHLGGIIRSAQLTAERTSRIVSYDKNPNKCATCGTPLSYDDFLRKKIFCNHKCRAASFAPIRKSLTHKHGCLFCGTPTSNKKFCNSQCCGKYVKQQTALKIKQGIPVCSSTLRDFIIGQRGHRCEHCGITEWLGQPVPLDLHHADGNSENDSPENLKLACKNCHALTPTFGNKNNGNGRYWRKLRRHAGKSA